MASIFDGFKPSMTDATVENPDYSEADLETVEPEEDAKSEEQSQVDFEKSDAPSSASESLHLVRMIRSNKVNLMKEIGRKVNKLSRLLTAMKKDGGLTYSMKTILLEEGVVDSEIIGDSAAEDAKEAAQESEPSEIAEKGATEEELAKASLKAQHKAYLSFYKKLKSM